MNKKSNDFEETVIRLFINNGLSVNAISSKLKCSAHTVNRIIKDRNLDTRRNAGKASDKIYDRILKIYNDSDDNIRSVISKFPRDKDIIYKVFENQNIPVTDKLIIDIFITENKIDNIKYIAKSSLTYFIRHQTENKFLKDVISYLYEKYDDSESLSETVARIYNKIDIRPVCKHCGHTLKYCNLNKPFQIFCSKKCSNCNDETKKHLRQTCLEKYGVTNSAKAESVKLKYKNRMESKYGAGIRNAFQAADVIKKSGDTKKNRYGSKTFNNRVKAEKTCIERYGFHVSSQNPDIKNKIVNSQNSVFLDKYGVRRPLQNKDVLSAFQDKLIDKYGAKSYLQSDNFENWCINTYGCRNPMQCPDIRIKQQYRYTYNNIAFDSAPEIAFYIWLTDVKDIISVDFEYSPNIKFEYEYDGRKYFYMPDFIVGNQLFEIKGDHFFNDSGKMINPYRNKTWSDEQYGYECAKYEAKHQCMLVNNVIILKKTDYKFFIDYINETYGNRYLVQFKNI